jgi:hypothetical protein
MGRVSFEARRSATGARMSKCSICNKHRRTGTGGRAMLLDAAGQLRTVLACAGCLERSIRLVALPPPITTTIESDDSDVKKVLRGLAKRLRNTGKAYAASSPDPQFQYGRAAFDQAADIADAWADERAARMPDATNDAPIVMQGWVCKTCRAWNGDEKERRETCRVCAGPRTVGSDVSHVDEQMMCAVRVHDHANDPPRYKRCLLRAGHNADHKWDSQWIAEGRTLTIESYLFREEPEECGLAAPFDGHSYCTKPKAHDGAHSWTVKAPISLKR